MPFKKDFVEKGIQLMQINEYLAKVLQNSSYAGVELRKTLSGTRIKIKTARPGLVIGKKGVRIRELQAQLYKRFKIENPQIDVEAVSNPELNAQIMAESIAFGISKGQNYRRTAYSVIRRIIKAGARGVEIKISGKSTSQRAKTQIFRAGIISKCGAPAIEGVRVGKAEAKLKTGILGIQLKLMPLDYKLPDEIILKDPDLKELEKKPEVDLPKEVKEELEEGEIIVEKDKSTIMLNKEEEVLESIFDNPDEEVAEESEIISEDDIEIEEVVEEEADNKDEEAETIEDLLNEDIEGAPKKKTKSKKSKKSKGKKKAEETSEIKKSLDEKIEKKAEETTEEEKEEIVKETEKEAEVVAESKDKKQEKEKEKEEKPKKKRGRPPKSKTKDKDKDKDKHKDKDKDKKAKKEKKK